MSRGPGPSPESEDIELDVRGARLAATITGSGPRTLVWAHGFFGDRWSEERAGLCDWSQLPEGIRLVRYDARGHGQSSPPTDAASMEWSSLGQDMLAVASAVGADRFIAGGASIGCATALHAAVAAPERIEALILMAPPTAWSTRPAQAASYTATVQLLRDRPERALRLLPAAMGTIAFPGGEASSAPTSPSRLPQDPMTLLAHFEGAAHSDLPPPAAVATLDHPTLILAWADDSGHPLSTADQLADLLPDSELDVVRSLIDTRQWVHLLSTVL